MTPAGRPRIGPYEVSRELGRGGMGVVYLARDPRLDRDVAIKSLPAELASDPARLERFEREARTLAQLNHPNLAGIHGVEEQDGSQYLVLEYVAGETLADRLDRGPLPVDEAVELAIQVAAGIEAAHEAGVIHRDLKPANIILTPDGQAKVLDFGLARTDDGGQSSTGMLDSPTLTNPPPHPQHSPTIAGAILGTAAYMSPEQARGRRVDKRSDIWSFGVVLYEMLTGSSPFHGETATDSIGAVLHKEFSLDALSSALPANVARVLRRCLERDRSRRYRDIGDVRLELADRESSARDAAIPRRRASPLAVGGGLVAGLALGLGLGLGAMFLSLSGAGDPGDARPTAEQQKVRRASLNHPPEQVVSRSIALSPDGEALVYRASIDGDAGQLYRRRLDEFESVPIPGTEGGESPFFSPDGAWLGFSAGGRLQRVPMSGGRPIDIGAGTAFGAEWTADGDIIFGTFGSGLRRVAVEDGEAMPLTEVNAEAGEISHTYPRLLPDGETVAFTVGTAEGSRVDTLSLRTGERQPLISRGSVPTPLFDDVMAFSEAGEIRVARYTMGERPLLGPSVPVLKSVRWGSFGGSEGAAYAVSRGGTLVYSGGGTALRQSRLMITDRSGDAVTIDIPPGVYSHPERSPDGRSIALTRIDERSATGDIWVVDLDRASAVRLTSEGANYTPIWTPDGSHVTYVSNGNILSVPADGSGPPEVLYVGDSYERPLAWTPDGTSLVFSVGEQSESTDLSVLEPDGTVRPLLQTPFDERQAVLSPDGRFIAYASDETGRYEVYVRAFPDLTGKLLVSNDGGKEPRWSSDGGSLFHRRGDLVIQTSFVSEPTPFIAESTVLFERDALMQQTVRNFDVFAEGDRFVLIDRSDTRERPEFRVVSNWFTVVREALGD